MAAKTLVYGLFLTALGLVGYFASGQASTTALIPCIFGLPIIALGVFTWFKSTISRQTGIAALVIALLAFGGTVAGVGKLVVWLTSGDVERPVAIIVQSIMAISSLIYVVDSGLGLFRRKS